jgi:hypothetical protein
VTAPQAPEGQSPVGLTFQTGPCSARFGEFRAYLLPARHEFCPPDDGVTLPWCWSGMVTVTFRIGEAQVSKRIRAKAHGDRDEPTDSESAEMFDRMEVEMRRLIGRHGIEFGYGIPWVIERVDPKASEGVSAGGSDIFDL